MDPLILVNAACALLSLGVGLFAGWWCFGAGSATKNANKLENEAEVALEKRIAAERSLMATNRIQDLAAGIANDVGDHNKIVKTITNNLKEVESADAEAQKSELATALRQLVTANEDLQNRLEKAESQIKTQALEIEAHESEAHTDSLTQLANRRAFDTELSRRFAEWQRKATTFSLMILDVDHFKVFNDTHGHQAGDEVLRKVAASLTETCREMDIPCRYGGEEFAIILPATPSRDATGLVERLRKGIESMTVEFEGKSLNVTASFGLAQITAEDNEQSLLKRADEALYAAKDAGRNLGYQHDNGNCIPVVGRPATKKKSGNNLAAEKVPAKVLDRLPNRTRFSEELRRRVSESHRTSQPLTVIAVDLAGYNDLISEFGEGVGRLTLNSLAQFLQAALREMDLLGRLNDGRFIIMLPGSDKENAEIVGCRVAQALSKCSVPIGDEKIELEAKLCVADLLADDTAVTIMSRAEEGVELPETPVGQPVLV